MGKKPRPRPERLAEKLLQIRNSLGISQGEMHRQLGIQDEVESKRISDYETGKNEPSLITILRYSRIAGVHTEALIDDNLDLPDQLPGTVKHEEIKRLYNAHRKSKR
ncbi:MAG TPA: helix-turn-helix transcriptional regulator [Pyrinomonadaceae bacterium]|nr:helix-turn-helix transcriptional regulator [Pyrinomonadaceae bacterium]